MTTLRSSFLIIIGLLFASYSYSQNDFYFGGGLTISNLEPEVTGSNFNNTSSSAAGFHLLHGYKWLDELNFELNVNYLGSTDLDFDRGPEAGQNAGSISYSNITLAPVYYPLARWERLNGYQPWIQLGARYSFHDIDESIFASIESKFSFFYGIGVEKRWNKWAARLGFESYSGDASAIKLGAVYYLKGIDKIHKSRAKTNSPTYQNSPPTQRASQQSTGSIFPQSDKALTNYSSKKRKIRPRASFTSKISEDAALTQAIIECFRSSSAVHAKNTACGYMPVINFKNESDTISIEDLSKIKSLVNFLKLYPNSKLQINSHAKNDGSYTGDQNTYRAISFSNVVKDVFLESGINLNRMTSQWYSWNHVTNGNPNVTVEFEFQ